MNLKAQLSALKNESRDLTLAERAELSCRLARQLEKTGDYAAAYEALADFWPNQDRPPKAEGLDLATKADLLLRAGALAGWQGSADQREGNQETAKNLITKSIEVFEKLEQRVKLAEAQGELALCYWREGSYDEARIHLAEALNGLSDEDAELTAVLLIRKGVVEADTQRLDQSLRCYASALPLVEGSQDHALKGSFHIGYGILLTRLATPENREDYLDQALIEYAAASYHFEQAGNDRYLARVENNLGFLYFTIGQYKDAHTHLDRARHLFQQLRDVGTAAQVDETRARTLIAQGHLAQAERVVRAAVRVLERGDQQAILAEALTTHGIVLARLGHHHRAKALFERAIEVAETTGDLEGAGRAKLSIIEELGEKFPAPELVSVYRSAIDLLKDSQDPQIPKRLITCAAKLLDTFESLEDRRQAPDDQTWEGFSLKKYLHEGEKTIIERALRDAEGSVSKAARLLGFKHHQSLISLLNGRHKELLKARSTVRKRRRHLFSEPKARNKKAMPQATSQISILHVEDNERVARAVADTLTNEGMRVDSCINGSTALRILKGETHYDVIIVDNNLPGLNGLELVMRARSIAHRRTTPILMLSDEDVEREAWRAGVDGFLLKPEAIDQISSTIARLLEEGKDRGN